jgi:hypothetical protein
LTQDGQKQPFYLTYANRGVAAILRHPFFRGSGRAGSNGEGAGKKTVYNSEKRYGRETRDASKNRETGSEETGRARRRESETGSKEARSEETIGCEKSGREEAGSKESRAQETSCEKSSCEETGREEASSQESGGEESCSEKAGACEGREKSSRQAGFRKSSEDCPEEGWEAGWESIRQAGRQNICQDLRKGDAESLTQQARKSGESR